MKFSIRKLSLSLFAALGILAATICAQENQDAAQPAVQATEVSVKDQVEQTMQSEELSIYGEIQSVDTQNAGSLTVQYYDYDTDEEKTISVVIDAATKLENATTIADIKKGDWADITYTVAGGKNTAKSIIVEKEEEVVTPKQASEGMQAANKEETAVAEDIPY